MRATRRPIALLLGALVLAAPLMAVTTPAYAADTDIRINEVESNGDATDWIEVVNTGTDPVDISRWIVKDNNDTRTDAIAAGTVVAPGAFYVIDQPAFSFGLGEADAARIFLPDGTTLIDSYSWPAHAPTTYGRNPDGTGPFAVTSASTKGAPNSFAAAAPAIVINEIESSGGVPGDWVELGNPDISTADASGLILRDDNDANTVVLPAGTTIESSGFFVVDVGAQFDLGDGDSVRLFDTDGTTLLDSYTWATPATTSYGRCPDLTGEFTTTVAPTRGLANECAGEPEPAASVPWPGSPAVATVDLTDPVGGDLSGLVYEAGAAGAAGDVLWAVENGNGVLYRLLFDGTNWVPDSGDWSDGANLRYPGDPTGVPDSEGVALTSAGSAGGVYVSSERNNVFGTVSRPAVLRYDVSGPATDLSATQEWNLAADLPGLGANAALEGISWIPDAALVASGFVDESTGAAYDPADYPLGGGGVFFVGVETAGDVFGYVLNSDGTFQRIASIISGFSIVAELEYDPASDALLVVCDQVCDGQITRFEVGDSGAFEPVVTYARPAGMPNIANEGFALAPQCIDGARAAFWADDGDTDGFSIREGTFDCTAAAGPGTGSGSAGTGGRAELAATGTDAPAPAALALGLLVTGLVLLAIRRRRTARR